MAHVAKGNMFELNACCTRWRISVSTGGIGCAVVNVAAMEEQYSCPLTSDGISVRATWLILGPQGPA